ncbi:MAG: hypothetical protein EBU90_26525, partial [Proteobacteria bacterium]|nr:hypothetical protein [Pseudomonadota bacterium]
YGEEEGKRRWKEYCNKQAYTNSYEYKNKKYGISYSEFVDYNKSRACTLQNSIKRYGEEEGKRRWKEYCDKQAYTNSAEYLGKEEYLRVNKLKSHCYESYLIRYGNEEIAKQKLEEYWKSKKVFYSKDSQKLFNELLLHECFKNKKCYYAELNNEYGLLDNLTKKYMFFDFVCPELKLVIEYNGDHFHGNPTIYLPSDYLKGKGCSNILAKEKWKQDEEKNLVIKTQRGFNVITVWESDYRENKLKVIERIIHYANNTIR